MSVVDLPVGPDGGVVAPERIQISRQALLLVRAEADQVQRAAADGRVRRSDQVLELGLALGRVGERVDRQTTAAATFVVADLGVIDAVVAEVVADDQVVQLGAVADVGAGRAGRSKSHIEGKLQVFVKFD